MRKIILLILLFVAFKASAQTKLKVTYVDSNDDNLYSQWTKKYLGKEIIVTTYDNSARLQMGVQDEIFKETSTNNYSKVIKKSSDEIATGYLKLSTTLSIITSANFKIVIKEIGGKNRTATIELTAKRF